MVLEAPGTDTESQFAAFIRCSLVLPATHSLLGLVSYAASAIRFIAR